jgi:hypothetical protein
VIEMAVGEEKVSVERGAGFEQSIAERTQAGAAVENQDVLATPDFHAWGITPVPDGAGTRARDTAANPPELQLNRHFKRPPPLERTRTSSGRFSSRELFAPLSIPSAVNNA